MPTYKFTRVYKITAASKAEGLEQVKANPTEYLEYESAVLVQEDTHNNKWVDTLKKQVTGK